MNDFDNRPDQDEMRQQFEKMRRAKRDLRGVGWTMLCSELIHTWLPILIIGVLLGLRIAPEAAEQIANSVAGTDVREDLYAVVAAKSAQLVGTEWYANVVVILTIAVAVLGVIPAVVYGRRRSLSLRPALGLNGTGARDIGLMYLGMMGVNALGVLGVMGTELVFNAAGMSIYIDIILDDTPLAFWLMNAYAVLLAPLVEEFVYRGVLLDGMRRYGDRFAVMASAVLFGLAHGNLMQFLPAVLVGWYLGYVRVKTGAWSLCVLLHALNNITSLALEGLMGLVKDEGLGTALNLVYIAAAVVVFVVVRRVLKKRGGELETRQPEIGGFALMSLPMIVWLYMVLRTMIMAVSQLA